MRLSTVTPLAWIAAALACSCGASSGQSASISSGASGSQTSASSGGSGQSGQGSGSPTTSTGAPSATAGSTAPSGSPSGSEAGLVDSSDATSSTGSVASSGGSDSNAPDSGSTPDASVPPEGGTALGRSNKVLIYTATTGFRHASIPAAATAIAAGATAAGLVPVLSPEDPTKMTDPIPADFAPGALAPYGAVVLLATSGQPLGAPGTQQIQTLIDFVEAGGGLVAIEDASHCYDGDFPPVSAPYIALIGGDFNGHTGFGPGTCATVGTHPTISMLPATFPITDEVYYFKDAAADVQVVLQCENPGAAPRPISWVRTQGAGRVFYTALGHADASWTSGPLVPDHVLPALLWTMGR
jgi:hypothetical protein